MLNVKRSIFIGLGKNGVQMLLKTATLLGNFVPAETRLLQYMAIDYEERLESAGILEGQKITRVALQPANASQFDNFDYEQVAEWLPVPVNEALAVLSASEGKNRNAQPGNFIEVFEAENTASSRRWFGRLTFYQNSLTVRAALSRVCKNLYQPENLEKAARANLTLQNVSNLQVIILADLSEPLAGGALLDLAYLLQERLGMEVLRPFNQTLTQAAVLTLPFTSLQASATDQNTFKTISLRDEKVLAQQTGTRGAQAYATLHELSLYMDRFNYAITYGDGSRITANQCPPFNGYCYLASAQNEAGAELAGPDKVHEMVAEWVQQITLGELPPLPHVTSGATAGFAAFGHYSLTLPVKELSRYFSNRWCQETLTALLAAPTDTVTPDTNSLNVYSFETLTGQWLQNAPNRPALRDEILRQMPNKALAAERFLLEKTAVQTEIALPAFEQQMLGQAKAMTQQFEQTVLHTTRHLLNQPFSPLQQAAAFTASCKAEIERTLQQSYAVTQQLEAGIAATLIQINQFRPAFLTASHTRFSWLAFVSLVCFSLLPLLTFSDSSLWLAFGLALAGWVGGGAVLIWLWQSANQTRRQAWQLYRRLVDLAGRRILAKAATRFAEASLQIANDAQGEIEILQQKLARLKVEYTTNNLQNITLQLALETQSGTSSESILRPDQLDSFYRRIIGTPATELVTLATELFGWRNLADQDVRDRLQLYANQKIEVLRRLQAITPLLELPAPARTLLLQKSLQLAQPYCLCQLTAPPTGQFQTFVIGGTGLETLAPISGANFIATFDAYRVILLSTRAGVPLALLPQVEGLRQHYTELTNGEPELQAHLHTDKQLLPQKLVFNRPATGSLPIG